MKKCILNISAFLCALVMFIPLTVSFAANTSDTAWGWDIGVLSGSQYTEPREKTNTTPIYFYVESITTNGGSLRVEVVHGNGSKLRNGKHHARFITAPGKHRCLRSNAYEDYGKGVLVKVQGDRYDSVGIKASGYWSPDSWSCK